MDSVEGAARWRPSKVTLLPQDGERGGLSWCPDLPRSCSIPPTPRHSPGRWRARMGRGQSGRKLGNSARRREEMGRAHSAVEAEAEQPLKRERKPWSEDREKHRSPGACAKKGGEGVRGRRKRPALASTQTESEPRAVAWEPRAGTCSSSLRPERASRLLTRILTPGNGGGGRALRVSAASRGQGSTLGGGRASCPAQETRMAGAAGGPGSTDRKCLAERPA